MNIKKNLNDLNIENFENKGNFLIIYLFLINKKKKEKYNYFLILISSFNSAQLS